MEVFLVLKLSLHHTLEQLFLFLILSLLTRLCWTSPKSHLMVYCLLLRKPAVVQSPPQHHLRSLHPRAGRPPPLLVQPLAIQTHAGPLAGRRGRVEQLAAPQLARRPKAWPPPADRRAETLALQRASSWRVWLGVGRDAGAARQRARDGAGDGWGAGVARRGGVDGVRGRERRGGREVEEAALGGREGDIGEGILGSEEGKERQEDVEDREEEDGEEGIVCCCLEVLIDSAGGKLARYGRPRKG